MRAHSRGVVRESDIPNVQSGLFVIDTYHNFWSRLAHSYSVFLFLMLYALTANQQGTPFLPLHLVSVANNADTIAQRIFRTLIMAFVLYRLQARWTQHMSRRRTLYILLSTALLSSSVLRMQTVAYISLACTVLLLSFRFSSLNCPSSFSCSVEVFLFLLSFDVVAASFVSEYLFLGSDWVRALCVFVQLTWVGLLHRQTFSQRLPPLRAVMRTLQVFLGSVGIAVLATFITVAANEALNECTLHNFQGVCLCRTKNVEHLYPATTDEVALQVQQFDKVRATGSGHSWNAIICPVRDTEQQRIAIVHTKRLDSIHLAAENRTVRCGAGVRMGVLHNMLITKYNATLRENWYPDVTIGGAVATGIHNDGIGFFECCVESVMIVAGNGTLRRVTMDMSMFKHIGGSVGVHGLIVEVEVRYETDERVSTPQLYKVLPPDDISPLFGIVQNNSHDFHVAMLSPRANLFFTSKRKHINRTDVVRVQDRVLAPQPTYSVPAMAFLVYQSLLSLVFMHVGGMTTSPFNYDRAVDSIKHWYKQIPPPYDNETFRELSLQSTLFATLEIDMIVSKLHLEKCLTFLVHRQGLYHPTFEIRPAQTTASAYIAYGEHFHVDFSISTVLMIQERQWLQQVIRYCNLTADGFVHHGKLSPHQVLGATSDGAYHTMKATRRTEINDVETKFSPF